MIQASEERITPTLANAFIGLGSNIESRLEFLRRAVRELKRFGDVGRASSVYETVPVGGVPQPEYLNAAVELRTTLGPMELVRELKEIERMLGRKDRPRWHEREIDLDLLFYDSLVLESTELTIPHPEAHRRAFVLEPMNELVPNFSHPILHRTISELLNPLDSSGVYKTEFSLA